MSTNKNALYNNLFLPKKDFVVLLLLFFQFNYIFQPKISLTSSFQPLYFFFFKCPLCSSQIVLIVVCFSKTEMIILGFQRGDVNTAIFLVGLLVVFLSNIFKIFNYKCYSSKIVIVFILFS